MAQRNNSRRGQQNSDNFMDYSLLFIIIFLVCFGLVMLYSTSSYDGQVKFGDSAYYVKKQFFATSLGFMAMYIISVI